MRITKYLAFLAFCILNVSLNAQQQKPISQKNGLSISQLAHYVNSALKQDIDELHDPGVTVSIIHDNRVILRNRKGVLDLEDHELIGPHSIFYIASVIKPLTAEIILQLTAEGKINLQDSIGNILPTLPTLPPYMKEVTVLNLLNHSSGIPDYYQHITWREPVIDNTHVLSLIEEKSDSLLFTPGEKFDYSNSNFILLAEIAEKVSGTLFPELMQERILKRLEMKNSFIFTGEDSPANMATGYRHVDGEFLINDYSRIEFQKGVVGTYNMKTYGAGGMFSNQSDLEKWVLNAEKLIATGQMELNGIPVPSDRYPFIENVTYRTGWFNGFVNQQQIFWHSGEFAGYRALVMFVPKANFGLIITSNNGSFSAEEFGMDVMQFALKNMQAL